MPHLLPARRGIYALALRVTQPLDLHIRQQNYSVPGGIYIYVGSAHGPGGVRARLGRHVRGAGRPRWHIDTLRARAEVVGWHYALTDPALECAWAQRLAGLPTASIPVPGFGASDCRRGCRAHLIHFPLTLDLPSVWSELGA